MTIAVIAETRPEIIKMYPIIKVFDLVSIYYLLYCAFYSNNIQMQMQLFLDSIRSKEIRENYSIYLKNIFTFNIADLQNRIKVNLLLVL
jgi:UDP-N-acetylglucosamine 2-epimerase